MKLSQPQKLSLVIWFIASPIVTYLRYSTLLPGELGIIGKIKVYPAAFFKQLLMTYLILGVVTLVLFFLKKEQPAVVKSETDEDDDEEILSGEEKK